MSRRKVDDMTAEEQRDHYFDLLMTVLWTDPYRSSFAGGLPADWVRDGQVTMESLHRVQRDHGISNCWDKHPQVWVTI